MVENRVTRRALARLLLLGGVAGLAAACGVKGPLEPPSPEVKGAGTFPRQYPREERPVEGGGGFRGRTTPSVTTDSAFVPRDMVRPSVRWFTT